MKKNICSVYAGIVTHNPDLNRLKENIDSIQKQVIKIIIVDNNSYNVSEIENLFSTKNMKIIKLDNNYGIAYALNKIFEFCIKEKIDWVLTLDQDSICSQNMIKVFTKSINKEVGIICPTIVDLNKKEKIESIDNISGEKRCITSGSLTSVSAFNKIGGFDEKMFIDGVDFDFCDRLVANGFKIIQCGNVLMKHEIGNIKMKKFLIFDVVVRNHSAFRKYYIAKNIVYLDRKNKYKLYPFMTMIRIIKLLLIVILYEKDKKNKIKRILAGMCEGFKEEL